MERYRVGMVQMACRDRGASPGRPPEAASVAGNPETPHGNKGGAQGVNLFRQQATVAFQEGDHEKVRTIGDIGAEVIDQKAKRNQM